MDVECLSKANSISSGIIPSPSSVIEIYFFPPSRISIIIFFEFASIEFSTNSLIIDRGFSITSPAAISKDISLGNLFILFIYILDRLLAQ